MLVHRLSYALGLMLVSVWAVPGVAQEGDSHSDAVRSAQEAEQASAVSAMDEEARQHFQIGKSLYDAGRFAEAATEFEQAYKKSKRPQLLYNLYVAQRDASNWAFAVEALRGYLEAVPDAPDRINLRARLKSMEDAASRDAGLRQAAEAQSAQQQAPASPQTRTETVHSRVPWGLMGAGVALLVGGGVTGILTKGKTDDLAANCEQSVCPPEQSSNIDSAKGLAITTDLLLGVGVVTAGVGAVLYFTGALDAERQAPVANLSCGPRGCAATLTGRF